MQDWFDFNGVRCTTKGIHVSEQPPITIPEERATFTDVPGRSGSLTQLEGDDVYKDLTLAATCFISSTANIDQVISYLKGSGKVTFANRQGGFYYGRIVNQIPFEKILRGNPHCSFSVNFRCKPFLYLNSGSTPVTVARSGNFVTNPGCVASEPVITITGSGDITLMVGMQIIELSDVDGTITIDSELQETYSGSTPCNEKMEGDYPLLQSGSNAISWDGNVSSVVITPNWRTL